MKPIETLGEKFDNISNLSPADIDRFWDVINNTKHVQSLL